MILWSNRDVLTGAVRDIGGEGWGWGWGVGGGYIAHLSFFNSLRTVTFCWELLIGQRLYVNVMREWSVSVMKNNLEQNETIQNSQDCIMYGNCILFNGRFGQKRYQI